MTAAFNLNLLDRINKELGGNFERAAYNHVALYNSAEGRIEMHLEAKRAQSVTVEGAASASTPASASTRRIPANSP